MAQIKNQTCALAMLDVLGFKNHLDGPDRQQVFKDFVEVVSTVKRIFHSAPDGDASNLLRHPGERTYMLSDTLFYTQIIDREMTAGHAVVAAATFATLTLSVSTEQGFLVRGAIAVGELLTCDDPEALAGPVVNECAVEYERGNWSGCHLAPSAITVMNTATQNESLRLRKYIRSGVMPLRQTDGSRLKTTGMMVDWVEFQSHAIPAHLNAISPFPLTTQLKKARATGANEQQVVKDYFKQKLSDYEMKNSIASEKVANTIAALRL